MARMATAESIEPFLKWAGGKRWFVRHHSAFIPGQFNRYFEPFLGGGAVFFSLQPQRATLADVNRELVETYQAIRDDWKLVWRYLCDHQRRHSKQYYYERRAAGEPRSPYARAARFIYLNRACWNGLYRVNKRGQFNVPIGTKQSIVFPTDDFGSVAAALAHATLQTCDFEELIDQAREGDFVFADPPYTINHNTNGFLKYNENIFSWRDQIRLKAALQRAGKRGARVVMTNADHASLRDLYSGLGSISSVPRHSVLAGAAEYRRASTELVITIGM